MGLFADRNKVKGDKCNKMKEKTKISFLISHRPDNRYEKRLVLLKDQYSLDIIYWNKTNNPINFNMTDVKSHEICIPANQTNPLKRLKETIEFIPKAYKELCKIHPSIVYVGNIDMLDIAFRYKKRNPTARIIYEIADLHRLIIDKQKNPLKKLISYCLKKTEKKLMKHVDLLVLTSMKFYETYYKSLIEREKVVFLPNMPEVKMFGEFKKKVHDKFTVGFIGWIRYIDQLKMLISASQKVGVNVLFAGEDGHGTDFEEYCKHFDNVTYWGSFDYSKEISNLYGMIDCSYAVYDADMRNVRLALPNKLYESVLCETPIVVADNTYLSELVEKYGVGLKTSHKNEKQLVEVLSRLKNDKEYYGELVNNCIKYKKEIDLTKFNIYFTKKIEGIERELSK